MAKNDNNLIIWALLGVGGFILYEKLKTPATVVAPGSTTILKTNPVTAAPASSSGSGNLLTQGATFLANLINPPIDPDTVITATLPTDNSAQIIPDAESTAVYDDGDSYSAMKQEINSEDIIQPFLFQNISGVMPAVQPRYIDEND